MLAIKGHMQISRPCVDLPAASVLRWDSTLKVKSLTLLLTELTNRTGKGQRLKC